MKIKQLKEVTLILVCLCMMAGCTNGNTEIGGDWVDVHTKVFMIDTCTIEISTLKLDSIATSRGSRIIVGARHSPYWGESIASTYMVFKTAEEFADIQEHEYREEILFDSLTLFMYPDEMFCGDTLYPSTYSIHKVMEPIEFNSYDELYAHSEFEYSEEKLAEHTFYPRPMRGRALEIRLSDEFGRELMSLLENKNEAVDSDENFREYLNGLMITADSGSHAISSFQVTDSTCMLNLYYHVRGYAEAEAKVSQFKVDTSYMFTHFDINLQGTHLEKIVNNEEIFSRNGGNAAYTQGFSGIYTKIGFPHLNNIRGYGDFCTAVSAELVIYPLAGTYNKQNYSSLPSTIYLYESDEDNISTGGAVTDSSGEYLQSGTLTYNEHFPEETYYTFDITDFINSQLGKSGADKRWLQIVDGKVGYSLGELIIGDQSRKEKNIELRIKLAIYDEK